MTCTASLGRLIQNACSRWLGLSRRAGVRAVIFGKHSPDWMQALQPGAPVWQRIPAVHQVLPIPTFRRLALLNLRPSRHRTVVIPLLEKHSDRCITRFESLRPKSTTLQILRDKAAFAAYIQEQHLGHLCPEIFPNAAAARFPCVLKRTNLHSGAGVRIVDTPTELAALLAQPPWRGHPCLLQEFVPGHQTFVTHCACQAGRILWHCTYAYESADDRAVMWHEVPLHRVETPAARVAEFESLLAPLAYSGPCNIDYKLTAAGRTAVLEINPRLGGSLMRPENVADLGAALALIIEHASSEAP